MSTLHENLVRLTRRDLEELRSVKGHFISVQDQYSLACRDFEEDIMTLSRELDMNPLTWGSLGQGILTGKYDRNVTFGSDDRRSRAAYVNFHGDKLLKNLEIVEHMRHVADHYGKPLSALAVRFILDYLPDSVVLCGVKRPEQILNNAQALDWHLSQDDIGLLEYISR